MFTLTLLFVLATTASADVLTWQPNSNWGNIKSWAASRLPCAPETVRFQLPDEQKGAKFVVKADVSVTLKGLRLPTGATLKLGKGVSIKFSKKDRCQDLLGLETAPNSVASFIGVQPHPWECANNWRKEDSSLPSRPPCAADKVVFPPGNAYSWISLKSQISVAEVDWMGSAIQSVQEISAYDRYFVNTGESASLAVDLTCKANQPDKCVCKTSDCSFYPFTSGPPSVSPSPCDPKISVCAGNVGQSTGSSFPIWPIIVAVVAGVLAFAALTLVIIFYWSKKDKGLERLHEYHSKPNVFCRNKKHRNGASLGSGVAAYRFDTSDAALSVETHNPTYSAQDSTGGFENPTYDAVDAKIYANDADGLYDAADGLYDAADGKFDEDGLPIA